MENSQHNRVYGLKVLMMVNYSLTTACYVNLYKRMMVVDAHAIIAVS